MNLINELDKLEDEIVSLNKIIISKQKLYKKLLNGAYSPLANEMEVVKYAISKDCKDTISNLSKYWKDYNYIKLELTEKKILVNINSLWNHIKPNDFYTKRDFIRELKNLNIVIGNSDEYYRSCRLGNRMCKALVVEYTVIHNLLKD